MNPRHRATCAALLLLGAAPLAQVSGARASDLFATLALERLAGGGLGDGAPAVATSLLPAAVLPLTDGSLWIADEQFDRVRRVDADGVIHTVVGSGVYGFNGDGLPALASHLGLPGDLAADAQGRLYLVDVANRRVRVLGGDGQLTTFVGPDHPLFTTVSGAFAPASVAIGPDGRVHVADRGANVVWQFDADGSGRRAAGDGERGFAGDGGPSALARLADPRAIAVGPDGAIWIADTGNRRLRVVGPDGRLHTVAGDGAESRVLAALGGDPLATSLKPIDVAVASDGQVLVLDALGNQVLRLGPAPRFVDGQLQGATALAVAARFGASSDPVAIAAGPDGRLWVADHGQRLVLVLDARAGGGQASPPTVAAGNGTARASGDGTDARTASLYGPTGLAFGPDGALYVADRANGLVRRIGGDGVIHSLGGDLARSLDEPAGVAVDAQGRLFIADASRHRVLRVDGDGSVSVAAGTGLAGASGDGGPAADAALNTPVALAVDGDGRLLIADAGNRVVRRIAGNGTISTLAGNGGTAPVDDGGPATASALLRPADVKVDDRGTVWIADGDAHRVYRLGADGLLRLAAGSGRPGAGAAGSRARTADLNGPEGVEPDGAGGVFIADAGNRRLVHVDADGILRVVAADGTGTPARLTTAADGALVFTDILTHRVLRLALERRVAPAAARVAIAAHGFQLETLAALPLAGLRQVVTHPEAGTALVGHRAGVTEVDAGGARRTLLADEADLFRLAAIGVEGFGASLLVATMPAAEQSKPLTLVRFRDGAPERFDLEYQLDGTDGLAVDAANGDVYLHQGSDGGGGGRLLRLRHDRVLNIPGFPGAAGAAGIGPGGVDLFASLPAEAAALAPAPEGGVYAALAASRRLLLVRDLDGDGSARGPLEQRQIALLPEAPVALAAADGAIYVGTEGNRIYRVDGSAAQLVAEGFAPLLLDIGPAPDGGLLVLEGDAREGRLLALHADRPRLAAWPTVLDLGSAALGHQVRATVVLRNDGPQGLRVTAAAGGGVQIDGETVALQPGEVRQFEVLWAPAAPGLLRDEILWHDGAGRVLLRLGAAVRGLAPRVESAAALDLGTAWVGGRRSAILEVRNGGDAELSVQGLELVTAAGAAAADRAVASGAFTAALPDTAGSARPGGVLSLRVELAPVARGAESAVLRIRTNDPLQPVWQVALRGAGGRAELDVTRVDLGSVPLGSRRRQQLVLTNTGDLDLRIDRIVAGTRQIVLTPPWLAIPAGSSRPLQVDFQPEQHGALRGDLALFTNDPAQPVWRIPYAGRGIAQLLELSAQAHDFGGLAADAAARWELSLTNHHTGVVALLSAQTDNASFLVVERPQSLDAGASGTVVVEYRATAPGVATGRLVLATDLSGVPTLTVDLRGRTRSAGAIVLDAPAGPVALWPGQILSIPVRVEGAQQLRGAVLTFAEGGGLDVAGLAIPETSLLHGAGPLAVDDRTDDGHRVGFSLTGDGVAAGVAGTGLLGELQLRLAAPGDYPLRLTGAVARGVSGIDDTLAVPTPPMLQLRLKGDLNGDGRLDLSDVFALVDGASADGDAAIFDLDGDGAVGPGDAHALIAHLPAPMAAKAAGLLAGRGLPTDVGLDAAYPNPFNASTVLIVGLPAAARTELTIYNAVGQRVARLLDEGLPAGQHAVAWNGRDDGGAQARSGVYFAVLRAGGEHRVQRLLLVR